MQPERWQKCTDIFNTALERPANERSAYVEESCSGDDALRRQIELLLKSHDQADGFIEAPAFETAPELLLGDHDALLGRQFGRYRIDSILGVGGMGVVYLAEDEQLGRKVGLKLLPPSLAADEPQLERLKREARTASALNHPNIVTIHEIGEIDRTHYIATEFIEGITLRERISQGPLAPNDAIDIATQLTSALAAAHAAGIVHRDIKPENIMLRRDGYVKILDFGIAKLVQPETEITSPTVTRPLILGTARYMSPEQARGVSTDARTDIWSLGVVLYEMVAGQPPFGGDTNTDVIASVLRSDPRSLNRSVPGGLQRIINRSLEKDPARRFQTADELRAQLQQMQRKTQSFVRAGWWSAAAAAMIIALAGLWLWQWPNQQTYSPKQSIAILPFQNLSPDVNDTYFAQGIQDEILTRLSKVADLKVISRASTEHYKSAPENLPEIARQLGVAHVVEGSVQKNGNTVRVNVQLINAANDSHIWAETFDRKLTDIFGVETEVAKAIAEQLRAKLTGEEEQVIASKPTDNSAAYDAYMRGRVYAGKTARSSANDTAAQNYLREAVRLDPKFAEAWANLSYLDSQGYITSSLQPTNALREEAGEAAETALRLQPNLGEALVAKGYYHYACLKEYDTAKHYLLQARRSLPNSSLVPETLAYLYRRAGEWDRSDSFFQEAEARDPRSARLFTQHALSYLAQRRLQDTRRKVEQVLNITPDDPYALSMKAATLQMEGNLTEAGALLAPLRPGADQTPIVETQAYQAILERKPAQIITRLQELLANPDPALGYNIGLLRFYLGWAQSVAGDHAAANESWRRARSELEPLFNEQPINYLLVAGLAFCEAGLGNKNAALTIAQRTMAIEPIGKDAVTGLRPLEISARVAAMNGDADAAISAIEKLLTMPMAGVIERQLPLTPALLQLDPMFAPLRKDPRFQKLIASSAPNEASSGAAGIPTKSIAVLPFQNLSKDEENAFFADGVQDQILTDVAKLADLKVISRTSVMQYKQTTTRNVREIARELGVAHVLEGSVQRAANRIRVNVQLINAQTDTHSWSETYDRDQADVFAIQSEIAKAIANQLQAKISPHEKAAIEQAPTSDLSAFELYSHAQALIDSVSYSAASKQLLLQAADLLEQAVARDSSFVEAYERLACVHDLLYLYGHDHTAERLAQGEAALKELLRLQPDSGIAHLARGRHLYLGYLDYKGALAELEIAGKTLPNNARVFEQTGYVLRRQGALDEGLGSLERALELDPRNVFLIQQISLSYEKLRRYDDMAVILDRALAIKPNDPESMVARGLVDFEWKADTRRLHQAIDWIRRNDPEALASVADSWLYCALAERDPADAKSALIALGDGYFGNDGPTYHRNFGEGLVARMEKDEDKARAAFAAARADQEKIVQEQPSYGPALCTLAMIDAALGRKEDALREGRHALELSPPAKDSINGPQIIGGFAVVAAWVGEKELACEQLETNVRLKGYGITSYGHLKLNPIWDPLRGYPRFEKIVASLTPKHPGEQPK